MDHGDDPLTHGTPGLARIEGRALTNFCAYDYVGMAHDPAVTAATKAAIDRYGTGAGASRLNLREPSVLLGFQVGGIVGHKFLSPYRVSLDLDRAELRMSKSTSN